MLASVLGRFEGGTYNIYLDFANSHNMHDWHFLVRYTKLNFLVLCYKIKSCT